MKGCLFLICLLMFASPTYAFTQQEWQNLFNIDPFRAMELQKRDYELQERCGRNATEYSTQIIKKRNWNIDEKNTLISYRNHYNTRMNKCFMHVEVYNKNLDGTIPKSLCGPGMTEIIDVNANKTYGYLFCFNNAIAGSIGDKIIENKSEWDLFVRDIMEE